MNLAIFPPDEVTAVSVKGFKSLAEDQRIEIRPLTILAGANSSGKSSALQPLLLLKQTLEADYDPGPLLLHDSHVKFTSAEQMLTRFGSRSTVSSIQIGVELNGKLTLTETFARNRHTFDLASMVLVEGDYRLAVEPGMSIEAIEAAVEDPFWNPFQYRPLNIYGDLLRCEVHRRRCFLEIESGLFTSDGELRAPLPTFSPAAPFGSVLKKIVHVPGLRGNPSRTYKAAAVEEDFPGNFESYVASIILSWQQVGDDRLRALDQALELLGLTWKVHANPIDATQVELLVGRLPGARRKSVRDFVSIADVGVGISQTLPVLVALLVAQPGQLVYIEQPELHLHPRAEQALATILAETAMRGVRLVAETHSSLLLLAIQTLVAEGKLPPDQVILHWFERYSRGATRVRTGDLDQMGAYGDWPEDFARVRAELDNRYFDAVESIMFGSARHGKKKTDRR